MADNSSETFSAPQFADGSIDVEAWINGVSSSVGENAVRERELGVEQEFRVELLNSTRKALKLPIKETGPASQERETPFQAPAAIEAPGSVVNFGPKKEEREEVVAKQSDDEVVELPARAENIEAPSDSSASAPYVAKATPVQIPAPGDRFLTIAELEAACSAASLANLGIKMHRAGNSSTDTTIRMRCAKSKLEPYCHAVVAASVVEGRLGWTIDAEKSQWDHNHGFTVDKGKRKMVVESEEQCDVPAKTWGTSRASAKREQRAEVEDISLTIPVEDLAMPQLRGAFSPKRLAYVSASYNWHSRGYRTIVLQSGNPNYYIFGCPRNAPKGRTDFCPAHISLKPADRDSLDGEWIVYQVCEEHNHAKDSSLGTWIRPPPRRKRVFRAKPESESDSAEGSGTSSEEEDSSDEEYSGRITQRTVVDRRERGTSSSGSRWKDTHHGPAQKKPRITNSTTPSLPPLPATPPIPSAPSRPLSIDDLGRILATVSPSLASLAPLFHQQGVQSVNSVLTLLFLPESMLAASLEKLEREGVSKLARRILVKKIGELRESWGK